MRRAAFVKNNQQRWKQFEDVVQGRLKVNPDKLAELFIQVTDDLAYSNTQYPDSDTTTYLNNLASRLHLEIYRNKKEDKTRIITFWTEELPLVLYRTRKPLLYSLIIFLLAAAIGAVSAANDETFVRLILSDQYVDMTLENIEKGEPMGVYGSMARADMFFAITLNNIMVSFRTFIWGGFLGPMPLFVFLSFGTGFILLQNGIMLGAFQYFFFTKGLLMESALIIWLHGTIEISSIIIAGGAGILAGNSLLFPGTYSRLESFKHGLRDGIKIIIGLVPLFILAGFIESFVTRLFEMPLILKVLIILGSLAFVVFYFIIYPRKVYLKHGK
ncbi:MAG: stage II sporulation protein M [Cyclobacteriaceae bacterium]|nr:stage II sporulation protein M [Cyclobacteriaceae bacterium]